MLTGLVLGVALAATVRPDEKPLDPVAPPSASSEPSKVSAGTDSSRHRGPRSPLRGPVAEASTFTNNTTIVIPNGAPVTTFGPATPYPSTIVVGDPNLGRVSNVTVHLQAVTHTLPDDVDVLLVSPYGTSVLLMSDACDGVDLNDATWILSDAASDPLPDSAFCANGTYQPINYGSGDTFDAPAPASGYQTALSAFDGENPNGTWSLFVIDDASADVGDFQSGWALDLTTGSAAIFVPPSGTSGLASPYPATTVVQASSHTLFGPIVDVDLVLDGVWHQYPDDLDVLLVGPTGKAVMALSDACGSTEIEDAVWTFDDDASGTLPDAAGAGCTGGTFQPTDYGAGEALPPPAPADPYDSSLSIFEGDEPVGTWSLFVRDDQASDVGFIEGFFSLGLKLKTVGVFRDSFESNDYCSWSSWAPPSLCD